jgi:hypothetical protein
LPRARPQQQGRCRGSQGGREGGGWEVFQDIFRNATRFERVLISWVRPLSEFWCSTLRKPQPQVYYCQWMGRCWSPSWPDIAVYLQGRSYPPVTNNGCTLCAGSTRYSTAAAAFPSQSPALRRERPAAAVYPNAQVLAPVGHRHIRTCAAPERLPTRRTLVLGVQHHNRGLENSKTPWPSGRVPRGRAFEHRQLLDSRQAARRHGAGH